MQTHNDEEGRAKVRELIKDIHIAQLVTQGHDGMMHARPMAAMQDKNDSSSLWFMTRIDSGKIGEIEANGQVLLAYSEPKQQNYVSISGKAKVLHDRARIHELWSEFARTWFPKGPDDPSIALIRVTPEQAEYWDSPSSTLVYAYGYLKARLTGESPKNMGDIGHVDYKIPA